MINVAKNLILRLIQFLGSVKPSNIRAKFENLAKQGEEESRKKAEEERKRRRLQEQQEEKEAKEREERRLRELKEKEAALVSHKVDLQLNYCF